MGGIVTNDPRPNILAVSSQRSQRISSRRSRREGDEILDRLSALANVNVAVAVAVAISGKYYFF